MIPAHLYNVPTLHHAFEFELLCNNVAARLLQGCHKVETVSNPKLFQGCGQVVTTLCNNLVTRLPHPCHKLGISVWVVCIVANTHGWRVEAQAKEPHVKNKFFAV